MDVLVRENPYKHGVLVSFFPERIEGNLLDLFESISWERRQSDFYRFDVPSTEDAREQVLRMISQGAELLVKRSVFEQMFGCYLGSTIRLEIHRYTQGCGIGPHTDAGSPEVRCVVNLNRDWNRGDGGIWILSTDSALRHPVYLPSMSNTGFVFATSVRTYHALSASAGGIAYGLTIRLPRIKIAGLPG